MRSRCFAAPAVAIPAAVYGAFLPRSPPHDLLFENLYPVDFLRAGGDSRCCRSRMPLTLSSFVELGGKLAALRGGVAALAIARRGRRRGDRALRIAAPRRLRRRLALVAVAVATRRRCATALKFAYGWIPAGAAVAGVVLVRALEARRATGSATRQLELAGTVVLAVVAATSYAAFFFHALHPQMAVYCAPLAAVFLARLHLVGLPGAAAHGSLGVGLARLPGGAAGIGLAVKDAHDESATVRGPGGALAAAPPTAAALPGARSMRSSATPHPANRSSPAPLLTGLHVLDRPAEPAGGSLATPGALPSAADRAGGDRRLERPASVSR